MRFYGLGLDEVWSMASEDEEMLWQAITVVEAQESLVALQISSYPHLKKEGQEKVHRKLHRMAYPENYEQAPRMSAEDALRIFNG